MPSLKVTVKDIVWSYEVSRFGPFGRVHDNVHDDMNMSLIMHDHKPVHSYDQHIIPHDQ